MTYILKAERIAESFEYDDLTRGPMMPAIGALFISLFGKSAIVLSISVRVFYFLSVIGFGALAWRLYGRWAGWLAVLYFAFAPMLNWPATRYHVDIFLLGFIVFAFWLLYETLQSGSRRLGAISGLLIGLAFLTKETAIMMLPLWVFGWLFFPQLPWRVHAKAMGAAALGFAALVLPWALYVQIEAQDAGNLLGNNIKNSGTFDAFIARFLNQPSEIAVFLLTNLKEFMTTYLLNGHWIDPEKPGHAVAAMGSYGWFMLAGVITAATRALWPQNVGDRLVICALALHLPFAIFLGWMLYDARQALVIVMLASLTIGAMPNAVAGMTRHISPWLENRVPTVAIFSLLIGGAAAYVSTLNGAMMQQLRGDRQAMSFLRSLDSALQPVGALNRPAVEAASWLKQNADTNDVIYSAHRRDTRYLSFALDNRVEHSPIEKHNVMLWLESAAPEAKPTQRDTQNRLIWIDANYSPDGLIQCIDPVQQVRGSRFCKIYYLREDDLLNQMKDTGADWLLVSSAYTFMSAYFDAHPAFEQARVFGEQPYLDMRQSVILYRVHASKLAAIDADPMADISIARFLDVFEAERPSEYERWKDAVLLGQMGLSPAALEKLRARDVDCFMRDAQRQPVFLECLE
ncbi:MAG: ArnT family glycosyltransferase [Pseudomonadota bacterium]|uniref:ArnT family glycosyltransferase n=1 Tax=Roseovarius salincola TaxID=2978479 RepID=UPI0022A8A3E6|nr:glycosyltransferase family 39 protein [Roseovarius sp. EGI FJ00037]MCZ0814357.1 glycosyltransferase family 39 protein [Roseovarius sp. EGI FJ00037]